MRPALGIVAIAPVLIASLYLLSYQPYVASGAVVPVLAEGGVANADLERVADAIDTFPAMANHPRTLLLQRIAGDWRDLDYDTRSNAFLVAVNAINRGIDLEPHDPQLLLSAIIVILTYAETPEQAMQADPLFELLLDAAPNLVQTHQSFATFALDIALLQEAIDIADNYVKRAPWTEPYFTQIREIAQRRLDAQG